MKRTIALLLATLFVLSMIACSPKTEEPKTETKQGESNTEDAAPEAKPAENEPAPASEPTAKPTMGPVVPKDGFDPITLAENDQCAVILTGVDPENRKGYTLALHMENRSKDQAYAYTFADCSVNGLLWDPHSTFDIAPDSSKEGEIHFYSFDNVGLIYTTSW